MEISESIESNWGDIEQIIRTPFAIFATQNSTLALQESAFSESSALTLERQLASAFQPTSPRSLQRPQRGLTPISTHLPTLSKRKFPLPGRIPIARTHYINSIKIAVNVVGSSVYTITLKCQLAMISSHEPTLALTRSENASFYFHLIFPPTHPDGKSFRRGFRKDSTKKLVKP